MAHVSRLSRALQETALRSTYFRTSQNVRVWRYRKQNFWAESGLCHVEDRNTGEYRVMSIRDFILRAKSFLDGSKREKYADERLETIRMVEDMQRCIKIAKKQGDPFQPGVMRQVAHDKRRIQSEIGAGLVGSTTLILPGSPQFR